MARTQIKLVDVIYETYMCARGEQCHGIAVYALHINSSGGEHAQFESEHGLRGQDRQNDFRLDGNEYVGVHLRVKAHWIGCLCISQQY